MGRWMLTAVLCAIPFLAHAQWKLQQDIRDNADCVLETGETRLFDGYNDTSLKLRLRHQELLVITDANVDFGMGDIGLTVDGNPFIGADEIMNETNILFKSDVDSIIEQFVKGNTVRLHLRFWPTYPSKGRHEARFSLIGFTKAYQSLMECLSNLHKDSR